MTTREGVDQGSEAEGTLGGLYEERQATGQHELLRVLRALRLRLVARPEIAEAVKRCRGPVSRRDFLVSAACLVLGSVAQALAVLHAPLLIPACLFVQVVGITGFNSLAHESWHKMAYPGREASRFVAVWIIAPLLLRNFDAPAEDHIIHHKMPGEAEDPSSGVWAQSREEFRRSMLSRALIVPAAVEVLRGLVTGKRPNTNWKDDSHKLSAAELGRIALVHGPWAVLMAWASPLALAVGWALPMALGSAAAHLREYAEHERLAEGRTSVYDTLCPTWQRLLIPGGYFNLHALHHIFPEIPQRRLPELYETIARTVDMEREYYGYSPQVGLRRSYLSAFAREAAPA